MKKELPFASIIIPCRNEEKYIGRCLDSIINQDWPKEKLEILVVNGASEDKTKEIVEKYTNQYSFIKILENHQKFTPFGLNIGIREAKGEIIIRMDAHAGYKKDYISKCVKHLKEYNADNVGGIMKTLPADNSFQAKSIAICLSHYFGAASSFRLGSKEPKEVDTVFGGCYRKEIFEKFGFFNEELIRSQDLEFNLRLKKAGGKILLIPDILAYYYPQSTLFGFLKHNFEDGIWAIYPLKFIKTQFELRHYIPLIFVGSLIGTGILSIFLPILFWFFLLIIFLYLLFNIYFSFKIASEKKDFRLFSLMPMVFIIRHFGYGLGSLLGLIKILF